MIKIRTHTVTWPGTVWNPFRENQNGFSLSYEGAHSVDWPLRINESWTIRLNTDWMDAKYPIQWQSLVLATMALATQHVFITITRNWRNLFAMLSQINDIEDRAIPVPADITYVRAIERANRNKGKFNLTQSLTIPADPARAKKPTVHAKETLTYCKVPWLPRNVFFGLQANSVLEAEEAVFVLRTARRVFPEGRFMVYQGPSEEAIDWNKLGLDRGTIDWLVWDGHPFESWKFVADFGIEARTPVFINEANGNYPIAETPDVTGVLV